MSILRKIHMYFLIPSRFVLSVRGHPRAVLSKC